MWTLIIFCIFSVSAEEDFRIVKLDSGLVRGDKYWNGDYYEFYSIPYATVPKGRDKFKAPLPVTPWTDLLTASNSNVRCRQCYYTDLSDEDIILDGEEECLVMNVIVPTVADEQNPVPVLVYIHSGAFSGGSGNMAKFNYLVRHDVVVVSFNYRVGAFGFACLGNEEIPGNAGLKDQVAALRWIKLNIQKFGGDPDKITLAGFSVGAAMAELLALSKTTNGLFNQLILESGSALAPFTINRDPVTTAWNIAKSIGYNGSESIDELTEFYLNAETKDLAIKSLNYFLPNSTFGFAPCIERVQGFETIVTESPLDTLKRGDYVKIPVITGFSNMEGLSRSIKFGSWREQMNENFENFLPADLQFKTEEVKNEVIKEIKKYYFNDKIINHESLQRYIDYFSDSMFRYSIMKSANFHSSLSKNPVYLYEFSYVGKLNIQHNYMDRIKGASHRDQTAYILDFLSFTNNYRDLTTRDRMTTMWTDFARYGNPTEFESLLVNVAWPPYTKESPKYLEINRQLLVNHGIITDEYKFWDKIYEKYYWNPTTVKPEINLPKVQEKVEKKVIQKDKEPPTEKNNSNSQSSKDNEEKTETKKTNIENQIPHTPNKNNEKIVNVQNVDNIKSPEIIKTTTKTKFDENEKLIKEIVKDENENKKDNSKSEESNKINQVNVVKITKENNVKNQESKNTNGNEKLTISSKTNDIKLSKVDRKATKTKIGEDVELIKDTDENIKGKTSQGEGNKNVKETNKINEKNIDTNKQENNMKKEVPKYTKVNEKITKNSDNVADTKTGNLVKTTTKIKIDEDGKLIKKTIREANGNVKETIEIKERKQKTDAIENSPKIHKTEEVKRNEEIKPLGTSKENDSTISKLKTEHNNKPNNKIKKIKNKKEDSETIEIQKPDLG